jgi:hypothetical protein
MGPDPGSEIRDPEKIHPGSPIQGVKSTGSQIQIRITGYKVLQNNLEQFFF